MVPSFSKGFLLVAVSSACFCTGCGTICAHSRSVEREFRTGLYRGARYDSAELKEFTSKGGPSDLASLLAVVGVFFSDFALCIVADTFLLPYDAFNEPGDTAPTASK